MQATVFTLIFSLWLAFPALAEETQAEVQLKPFTSDGCSFFPDGTLTQQNLWLGCCIAHDMAYWKGGSYEERLVADEELRACVSSIGEQEIAQLMLTGVRVGGSPYWVTTYRWGYGWPYWDGWLPRGYKGLTEEDQKQVSLMLSLFLQQNNDSPVQSP